MQLSKVKILVLLEFPLRQPMFIVHVYCLFVVLLAMPDGQW
jgi:hypothetical protein